MILSGLEIKRMIELGHIKISDFDEKRLNPNSYNLRLHNELMVYTEDVLDMKKDNPTKTIIIPEEGYTLEVGELYLGRTVEFTETLKFAPMLEGRSSIGRLGIDIHVSAGFGDIGHRNYWTLEIRCTKPVTIYPNVELCQIAYHTVKGKYIPYNGKYQNTGKVQSSQLYKDFEKDI